jgi:uncharacterized protein (UPF0332 family)
MVQPMDKRTIANERLEKARRGLAAAKWMTDNSDYAGAVAKAYFIFLDLADAGLVTKGITPQSHAGTVKMFGMHFVKTGLVPPEYGRWFGKMEEERIDADYKMKTVWTKEDAQRRVERAEKLLAMMESIVVKNLEEERE